MKTIVLTGLLMTYGLAQAHLDESTPVSSKYFEITDIVVEDVTSEIDELDAIEDFNRSRPNQNLVEKRKNDPFTLINNFIVLGEKIWKIVEAGKPIANIANMKTLDVLPGGKGGNIQAFDLSGWSLPRVRAYKVEMKNGFGAKVIDFKYRLFYSHGGSLDGSGAYLTGVTFEPTLVSPSWGFKLDVETALVSVTDVGNTASGQVAALTVQLRYRARSIVSDMTRTVTYTITGDGRVLEY